MNQASRSERVARATLAARRVAAQPAASRYDSTVRQFRAEDELREVPGLLQPPANLRRGGREAIPDRSPAEQPGRVRQRLLDTLENPNSIAVEASSQRLEVALDAGVLPMAMDAAHSARSTNPLETMLCHQLAAAHNLAMTFAAAAANATDALIADRVRLANASARLMQAYQEALLALQKFRTGGQQTVVVQHVNVEGGGRAVVAGQVELGAKRKEGDPENDRDTP